MKWRDEIHGIRLGWHAHATPDPRPDPSTKDLNQRYWMDECIACPCLTARTFYTWHHDSLASNHPRLSFKVPGWWAAWRYLFRPWLGVWWSQWWRQCKSGGYHVLRLELPLKRKYGPSVSSGIPMFNVLAAAHTLPRCRREVQIYWQGNWFSSHAQQAKLCHHTTISRQDLQRSLLLPLGCPKKYTSARMKVGVTYLTGIWCGTRIWRTSGSEGIQS